MPLTKVTYSMIEGASFNVEDYGADKTGVADSKNAINLAFAAMEAAGGGTIYFPKGTYYISGTIGNQTNPSSEISFAIVGEPGTVINCNPSVYSNRALNLYYASINTALVKNLIIQCNTKTNVGIYLRTTAYMQYAEVDACEVYNCHAVNDAGVTDSVFGIFVYSDAWSYTASVTNCIVQNLTRAKTGLACQAIALRGFENTYVANNNVENVRHSNQSGDIQDADGIVVFSHQNGSGNYEKSNATIKGNTIRDCEGRFIKLQTNGSALVENNLMSVYSSLVLIDNWHAIDSQVGDSTVVNNTIYIGNQWTGGSSAGVFAVQTPTTANVDYSNEGFFQRFNNNNVEVLKRMTALFVYIFPVSGVTANCYMEINGNTCNWPSTLNTTTQTNNYACEYFIYTSTPPSVANTAGQVIWKICNNTTFTYNYIYIPGTQADYANKWYFFVHDNFKPSIGYTREITYLGKTQPYTSTCMFRDNTVGQDTSGYVTWPFDSTKLLDGCDFLTADQTIANAPAVYNYSRWFKKASQYGVQNAIAYYISTDGTTWLDIA